MASEFKLPDLGEGVHEGQIIQLLVAEGEHIAEDQPLMEVETDKAAVEIPSPYTGTVLKWHVKPQQVVHVGDVMVAIGAAGETVSTGDAARTGKPAASVEIAAAERPAASSTMTAAVTNRRRPPASPAVRKLARTRGINLETITGSGPGGRILRSDVERSSSRRRRTEHRADAWARTGRAIGAEAEARPRSGAAPGRRIRFGQLG